MTAVVALALPPVLEVLSLAVLPNWFHAVPKTSSSPWMVSVCVADLYCSTKSFNWLLVGLPPFFFSSGLSAGISFSTNAEIPAFFKSRSPKSTFLSLSCLMSHFLVRNGLFRSTKSSKFFPSNGILSIVRDTDDDASMSAFATSMMASAWSSSNPISKRDLRMASSRLSPIARRYSGEMFGSTVIWSYGT